MINPDKPTFVSPLESLGIELTPEQVEEVLDRVEARAIAEAEDDQPASQETPYSYMSPEERQVHLKKFISSIVDLNQN